MHQLELLAIRIRHSRLLHGVDRFWSLVRPVYDFWVRFLGRRGLPRRMNGTDLIRVVPELRGVQERYEPELWALLMSDIQSGDVIADVGAHHGLYAIAMGLRLRGDGQVIAFEPNPGNLRFLQAHIALNGIGRSVRAEALAVSNAEGEVLLSDSGEQSRIAVSGEAGSHRVRAVTLDGYFKDGRLDILKIDVEGFEEWVLRGASRILADASRRPRLICVEVHPYAWAAIGTASDSLLEPLRQNGYIFATADGLIQPPILRYGHVVARRDDRAIRSPSAPSARQA